MGGFRKSSYTSHEFYKGQHRSEHWYRDNTVYFITATTITSTAASVMFCRRSGRTGTR